MSDLDALRAVVRQLTPPDFDDLVAVARRRRLRYVTAVSAAAAVVILAAGLTGNALSGNDGTQELRPVDDPTPTKSSKGDEWTPDRIREEGSGEEVLTTTSGLSAYQYLVCDGPGCDDTPIEDWHVALEVTQDDRSALFDVLGREARVKEFDGDSLLVQDAEPETPDDEVRVRLLQADGTAVELRRLDGPAPAVPGPEVVVIDTSNGLLAGSDSLYFVDDRAGTVQSLDAPKEVRYWGPNVDEFLWGVTDDCRVFWANDGAFEERQLDCSDGLDFTYGIYADEFPLGWLQPGRMAVGEQGDGRREDQNFVHVSLDYGVTWQRLPVGDGETVADVLQRLS